MRFYTQLFIVVWALLCAQISYAEVELPLGNYHQTTDDITVKVKGGFVKASRTYYKDTWLYNRAWNNLEIEIDSIDGSVKSITRNNNGYDRPSSSSSLYEYDKTKWIRKTASGFRWEDRKGNWIEYNDKGVIQKYGDRNNVEVSFKYNSNGQRTGVFDHFGTQVLWYTYYINGKIETIRDATPTTPRTVKYIYTGDNLTQVIDVRGNTWKYEYSGKRLTKAIDPDGRPTNIAYHANGATKSVTLADGTGPVYGYNYDKSKREYYLSITLSSGRVTELWYNRNGELIRKDINGITTETIVYDTKKDTTTNELGQVTVREYDDFDNLIKTTYPDGSSKSATYGSKYSNRLTKTNENGVITKYEYNALGNLIRATEAVSFPEQRITEYQPNLFGEIEKVKRIGDSVTVSTLTLISYDKQGNMILSTDPEGNITSIFKHDLMGNPIEWLDGRNKLWKAEFDSTGNIVKTTNPLGISKKFEYDGNRNFIKYFDQSGKLTQRIYNKSNRLYKIIDSYLNTKLTTYNTKGQIEKISDQENKVKLVRYDDSGRLLKKIDGNNNALTYSYGNSSQLALFSQRSKIVFPTYSKDYYYDNRGRVVKTVKNYDNKNTYQISKYDAVGNIIESIATDGKVTKYLYDKLNRVTRITNPQLKNIFFSYDNRNNKLAVVNENSNTIRRYTYNKNNKVKTIAWPSGEVISYTYNANSQLQSNIDSKASYFFRTYDDAGRFIRKEIYQSPTKVNLIKTINFNFNNSDSITGYNDGITSSVYEYDDKQRRITEIINYPDFSKRQNYTYYKNNRLRSYKGPDNIEYVYSYDSNNQFSGMSIPAEGQITVNQYKWYGPLKISLPGGGTKINSYDGLMRKKSIISEDSAANLIQNLTFSFYLNDTVKSKSNSTGLYDYLYDSQDRLTTVTSQGNSIETFSYDFSGNRLTSINTIDNWSYNTTNQLLTDTVSIYSYNSNGSLKDKTTGSAVQRYKYNIENRLTEVLNTANLNIVNYYYDPFGRRLWKDVGGRKTYFMPRKEGIAAEFNNSGNILQTYGYEPSTQWGTRPLITKTSTGTFYYHLDHIGTPQIVTDKSGKKVWQANYSSFGYANIVLQKITNNLRFPGQYFDAETGYHQNYFRDYDPETGRYIQSDPIGIVGGINTYNYAGGNPLYWVDPLGLALTLPNDPSGLPPEWSRDDGHKNPNGEKWNHPDGSDVEWHPGTDGAKGWKGKDHWHANGEDEHYPPGTTVDFLPDPLNCPKDKDPEEEPKPEDEPEAEPDTDSMEYWEEVTGLTGIALIIYLIISEGSRLFPPRNLIPIP